MSREDESRYWVQNRSITKGIRRLDRRIWEDVCDYLSDDLRLGVRHIDVEVISGEVILKGTMPKLDLIYMVENLVERVPGVIGVRNLLGVEIRGAA